jgi:hypothetical protein
MYGTIIGLVQCDASVAEGHQGREADEVKILVQVIGSKAMSELE